MLILSSLSLIASAQHYPHFLFWSRLQLSKDLSPQWGVSTIFHLRRQNNYLENAANPFFNPLMKGAQAALTYKDTVHNYSIIVAQIQYQETQQLLGKEEDFKAPSGQEIRFVSGVEWRQEPTDKILFRQRLIQELRFFKANQNNPVGRIRGRLNSRYQLFPFVSINGVTELLIHDPPRLTSQQKLFRFHQFWLGSSLIWSIGERVSLETGYTFIHGRRSNIVEFDEQNIINFHIAIDL